MMSEGVLGGKEMIQFSAIFQWTPMAFRLVVEVFHARVPLMLSTRSLPIGHLVWAEGWPLNQIMNLMGLGGYGACIGGGGLSES